MYITTPLPARLARSVADLSRPNIVDSIGHSLARLWSPLQRVRSRADEAAEVRAMAWRVRDSDPGFASDLLAAADRHETTAP
jgi:hypothetical protein